MPTNQEYLDRWEASAPTPVDSRMTAEEIQKAQGTRNSEKNPWETYDPTLDPDINKALEK